MQAPNHCPTWIFLLAFISYLPYHINLKSLKSMFVRRHQMFDRTIIAQIPPYAAVGSQYYSGVGIEYVRLLIVIWKKFEYLWGYIWCVDEEASSSFVLSFVLSFACSSFRLFFLFFLRFLKNDLVVVEPLTLFIFCDFVTSQIFPILLGWFSSSLTQLLLSLLKSRQPLT